MREKGLIPEVIFSSAARRAVDTARLAAEAAGFEGEIHYLESLYLAGPEAYLDALRTLPETVTTAMAVGHNPGAESLLTALTGAYDHMPTAALAHIRLPIDRWSALTSRTKGELLHLWQPCALSR
jgi:phosphohistidine phosphatase